MIKSHFYFLIFALGLAAIVVFNMIAKRNQKIRVLEQDSDKILAENQTLRQQVLLNTFEKGSDGPRMGQPAT